MLMLCYAKILLRLIRKMVALKTSSARLSRDMAFKAPKVDKDLTLNYGLIPMRNKLLYFKRGYGNVRDISKQG